MLEPKVLIFFQALEFLRVFVDEDAEEVEVVFDVNADEVGGLFAAELIEQVFRFEEAKLDGFLVGLARFGRPVEIGAGPRERQRQEKKECQGDA